MEPTLIFYSGSDLLEGPVYDKENDLLYFVSILDHMVYCFDSNTKEICSVRLDSPVSCVYIRDKRRVLAASRSGFFEIDFNTLQKQFVFQIDIERSVRYNDGIQDPLGRIIIGTMGFPKVIDHIGKVYSYYKGSYKTIIENTTISNGLAFSDDGSILYFIDTPTKKVARYYYDLKLGDAKFDSYIIHFKDRGSPDGMSIDSEGMLWIAEWGGGVVSKWNPFNGDRLEEYKLPCINVTSCCFDKYSNLYVTTAKSESIYENLGGGLFYFDLH